MIEGAQDVEPSQEQDTAVALRYDVQVIFKSTTRGVTSVNWSKCVRDLKGIGQYIESVQCMKW
jgi:hypothetical protein